MGDCINCRHAVYERVTDIGIQGWWCHHPRRAFKVPHDYITSRDAVWPSLCLRHNKGGHCGLYERRWFARMINRIFFGIRK